ncbi:Uncharacterised protein [Shigella sonnei]|nr:Uncharacterised protein [Shigella sonnei]
MDKYNLKDALLFISRGDTHEILIETNQRTRPDVQSNLQELLKLDLPLYFQTSVIT